VQRVLKRLVAATVRGPASATRATRPVRVWGEVTNAAGERRTARVTTASLYSITVDGALAAVAALQDGRRAGGYYTPAQLLGADLVTTLPGSSSVTVD
jgi:short subunit dehydrogenase-like uncharacterized protein